VGPPKFFPTRKIKADASIHGKNGYQLSGCLTLRLKNIFKKINFF
jgi:hypothetical protein